MNAERDQAIWRDRIAGWSYAELAEKYDLSVRRITQIMERIRGTISVSAADYRHDFAMQLDRLRREAQAIVDAGPVPAFSSKGDQLFARASDDDESAGVPVMDHGARLAAMAQIVNIQARAAKLGGFDAAEKAEIDTTVRYVIEGGEDV